MPNKPRGAKPPAKRSNKPSNKALNKPPNKARAGKPPAKRPSRPSNKASNKPPNKARGDKPPAKRSGKKSKNNFLKSIDLPSLKSLKEGPSFGKSKGVDVDFPDLFDRISNGNQFITGVWAEGIFI